MGVNLYGNINGQSYTAPNINLLESTKTAKNAPVTISETSMDKDISAVKLNISEEGLKALHGSKLNGSADPFETAAKIAYMSEHQPIESFTSQFSQMMPKNYTVSASGEAAFEHHSIEEKEKALTEGFKALYDKVSKEYDEGTRVRYIEDSTGEDGYRKLSKDEELAILKMEFDDYVDSQFGDEKKAQDAAIKEAIKEMREIMKSLGKDVKATEPESEEIPNGFAEKLKNASTEYAEKHDMNISLMKDFINSFKKSFSPMEMNLQKLI